MGYRSNIGAVISVDKWWSEPLTKADRDEQIAKYKEMIGLIKLTKFYELMSNDVDKTCIGWKGGEFYFHAENWKWYPDYDVVIAWDELWSQMQGVEGVSGYFARVGEETDDIVQEHFGDNPDYDAFSPITYLNCEVSDKVFNNGDIDKELEEMANNVRQAKNVEGGQYLGSYP
jgi:hypothetical protein